MSGIKQRVQERLSVLPPGAVGIMAGLLTLGFTNYLFLVIAGQILGDAKYAPLGVLWIIVFLLGPGFLYPIEQEVARAVAARRAVGDGIAPIVRRASVLAAGIAVILVVVVAVASSTLNSKFFDNQTLMLVGLVFSLISYSVSYVARGTCAGNGRLNPYGAMIASEGLWRVIAAGVFAIVGVKSAGPYGLIIGITPLIAVVLVMPRERKQIDHGSHTKWSELSASLGSLIAAAVLSQVLLNATPLFVKYESHGAQQELAGAFLKAVIITRIPMFLFQAVQAIMLPRLTSLATRGEWVKFKTRLFQACVVVGAVGLLGVAGSWIFGNFALSMFGSNYPLPRSDLVLLAAGCAIFLVATMVGQALIAVSAQGSTVIGWAAGVIVYFLALLGPGSIEFRAEFAMILGSAASLATLYLLMNYRVARRQVQNPDGLVVINTVLESEQYA